MKKVYFLSILLITLVPTLSVNAQNSKAKQRAHKSPNIRHTMNTKPVREFASAINSQNIEKLYVLMADDHKFIDAHGNEIVGKDKMRAGWSGYF